MVVCIQILVHMIQQEAWSQNISPEVMLVINCMKIFCHQRILYDIVEFSVRVVRQNYQPVLSDSKQLLVSRWLCLEFMLSLIEGDEPYKDEKQRNYMCLPFPAWSHLFENMWVVAAPYLAYSLIVKPCLICNKSIVQDVDSFRNEMSKPLAVTYSFVLSRTSKLTYFVNSVCTKLQTLRDLFKFPQVNPTCLKNDVT
jgi:hypothetical protein